MISRPRLATLIGGGGRTLLNILDCIEAGRLDARIELVVASRPGIPGIERARQRGLEPVVADTAAGHDAIAGRLKQHEIDLVCLCGWLRWYRVDPGWHGRVMNIHPALLPDFGGKGMYGARVHQAVLAARRASSGCTVHFVDDRYDAGPIILQRVCPVLPDDDVDTLAARVFELECEAYPQAIQWFSEGRLRLVGDRVEVGEVEGTKGLRD